MLAKGVSMENIPEIFQYARLPSWYQTRAGASRRKIPRRPLNRRAGGKYYALTRLANDTHQTLKGKNSPLRLCVYGNENDLHLDVITLDKDKRVSKNFTRPITNGSFNTLVKNIHNQLGLVIDYRV